MDAINLKVHFDDTPILIQKLIYYSLFSVLIFINLSSCYIFLLITINIKKFFYETQNQNVNNYSIIDN